MEYSIDALLQFFWTPLGVAVYLALAFPMWYLLYGTQMHLNGGPLGRSRFWVFECLWEDILFFTPGGLKRRAENVRIRVSRGSGYMPGPGRRTYSYEEIRDQNLYEEVATHLFGTPAQFWVENVLLLGTLSLLFGPLLLVFYACLTPLVIVVGGFVLVWSRQMQWNPLPPPRWW